MCQKSATLTSDEELRTLRRAVLSSCSDRNLVDLMCGVRRVRRVRFFDLLILRGIDIVKLTRRHERRLQLALPAQGLAMPTSTEIMAVDEH